MGKVIIEPDGPEIEEGLTKLERRFPNIREDYQLLLVLLSQNPLTGWPLKPKNHPKDQDKRYCDLYSRGGKVKPKDAAVLVYTSVLDEDHDYLVTPIFVCSGAEWVMEVWKAYANKLVGLE